MISQQTTLQTISKHSNFIPDLSAPKGLRSYILEADVIFRNPKSGSVPALTELITPEQRAMLVEDVLPQELYDDEKTMWYLDKLNELGSSSMIPIEKYQSNKKNIAHKCIVCGYEAEVKPINAEFNAKKGRRGCNGCNHRDGTSLEDAQRLFRYKRPDLEPLSGYQKKTDKIPIRCLECRHEWETQPHYVLLDGPSRSGCPECGKKRTKEVGNICKTTEQFKAELADISPDIKVVGEYVNNRTYIKVKHVTCNHEWEAKPNKLLNGQGCPKCHRPRRTNEDYLRELAEKGIEYVPQTEYAGVDTKIPHLCPECNKTWDVSPYNILLGYGCPRCKAGRVEYTDEEFTEKIHEQDPFVDPVTSYAGSQKPARFHCRRCDHEWEVLAYTLLSPRKSKVHKDILCPKCAKRELHMNTEEFKALLAEKNPDVELYGEYRGSSVPNAFLCQEHEEPFIWEAWPGNILRGIGCPKCHRRGSFSEDAIFYYLSRDYNGTVMHNPRVSTENDDFSFEADILLPDKKVFIEYDGVYWHDSDSVDQRYQNREQVIYDNGYTCIHIAETAHGKTSVCDWMVEDPIEVNADKASVLYEWHDLNVAIRELEQRLGFEIGDIDCKRDRKLIEEFSENSYTIIRFTLKNSEQNK